MQGGEFLTRGGTIHPMGDGSAPPARIMVARFDSVAAARSLFEDPEFVALREQRHQFATPTAFVIAGV